MPRSPVRFFARNSVENYIDKKDKKNVGRMHCAKKMKKSVFSSLYYFLSLRLSHLTSAIILGFLLFTGKCDEFKPDNVGKKKK